MVSTTKLPPTQRPWSGGSPLNWLPLLAVPESKWSRAGKPEKCWLCVVSPLGTGLGATVGGFFCVDGPPSSASSFSTLGPTCCEKGLEVVPALGALNPP